LGIFLPSSSWIYRRTDIQVPLNGKIIFNPIASLAARYEGLHLPTAVLLDDVRGMYNVGTLFSFIL
jgi:hypothetical protein